MLTGYAPAVTARVPVTRPVALLITSDAGRPVVLYVSGSPFGSLPFNCSDTAVPSILDWFPGFTSVGGWLLIARSWNVTGLPPRVPTVAVTLFCPGVAPSVNPVEANPLESVIAVVALTVPPPVASANATAIPGTGRLFGSVTF